MRRPRPIITLTTDFGSSDHYVAAMKGALLRYCREAVLVDVTHEIPPQNILAGSIALERAVDAFPAGTVHLAVVDPGVGTGRRLLVVQMNGTMIVCPDNGLITWGWRMNAGTSAREIIWRPAESSNTFHGRDIMAPIAGMIAAGKSVARRTKAISDPKLLALAPSIDSSRGEIIHIDHFGNATTNITSALLKYEKPKSICLRGVKIGPLVNTYADVACGKPLALIGSSGLLEIAVRDGSAEKQLGVKTGDKIYVT